MTKHYLNPQGKLNTNKKMYAELYDMLTEWFKWYYDENSKNKNMLKKYHIIRRVLRKYFSKDVYLSPYIKKLPNVYTLKSGFIEILLIICFVLLRVANAYLLNIYIGVTVATRGGGETDLINIILFVVFVCIYLILFHKRLNAYSILKYNLLEIKKIVAGGSKSNAKTFSQQD